MLAIHSNESQVSIRCIWLKNKLKNWSLSYVQLPYSDSAQKNIYKTCDCDPDVHIQVQDLSVIQRMHIALKPSDITNNYAKN